MTELPDISTFIWDSKYRLKEFDGTPVDLDISATWRRVANALADAEKPADRDFWANEFFRVMSSGLFSPAGRIIAGAGTGRRVTLSNCFTMGTIPDSMDGIFSHLREAALTMQQGGGIGYDFSTIRPKGALVKGVGSDASGPLTFMDVWDAMCRTVMSAGSRRGAMMATMRCDHPDIEAFIEAKRDPLKLRMFNLSVLVTDEFMQAVEAGHNWRLHFEDRHGTTLVERVVDARELWDKIMRSTYDYAEPGVIFIDRVNDDHNLGYLETIATTNPCGEKPMGPYASCLLGSINLAKLVIDPFTERARVNRDVLSEIVGTAIRMMDNVIEVGGFPIPEQKEKAQQDRQLGLGVTGLADALIMSGLTYGSDEAVGWTESIMRDIAIAAYRASCALAKDRGPFPTFVADEFLKPTRFAGRMLPRDLQGEIRRHGIRNGLLLSIAPTGTISLFAGNVSSGIEPVFALSYDRKVLQPDGSKITQTVQDYAVAMYRELIDPDRGNMLPDQFVTAQTLTPMDHVRMQAAAQKWVDSSISKTVNVPEHISFEEFKGVYHAAYQMGCKGCTTYRPNDVTGSVLSVKEEPKPITLDGLKQQARDFLDPDFSDRAERKAAVRSILNKAGVANINALPEVFWPELKDVMETWGAADPEPTEAQMTHLRVLDKSGACVIEGLSKDVDVEFWPDDSGRTITAVLDVVNEAESEADEGPQERPEVLDGTIYKIKLGSDPAIYVTISDIECNGKRRPFEVFVNTKNPEHIAWSTALTRMVSAIFRRPHDSSFVVEELKNVFDPKGGGFWKGQYRPSVVAAIGQVLEDHMRSIGYGSFSERKATVPAVLIWPALPESRPIWPGPSCQKCGSFNVKKESGCFSCLDCGDSKCG